MFLYKDKYYIIKRKSRNQYKVNAPESLICGSAKRTFQSVQLLLLIIQFTTYERTMCVDRK